MSAYKTAYIRLGEKEYRRLREAEEQHRLDELMNHHVQHELNQSDRSIYENMLGIKRENDKNFQNIVVDLESEISRIEDEASLWVEKHAVRLQTEFSQNQKLIQQRASDQITDFINEANRQFYQQDAALRAFWEDQEARIMLQEQQVQEYVKQAQTWILKSQQVLYFIYDSYLINPILANQLEMQREFLNQVIQQFNSGYFEIAASAGFQIFNNLSNLRFHCEIEHVMQATHLQKIIAKKDLLQQDIENSKLIHAMDGDGNELPEIIDVNYWVEGRYQEFSQCAQELFARIIADPTMTIEQIMDFDSKIEELSDQLVDLVTQARINVLASQLRFNVAQIIVQSLEIQGFFLENANYEKNDYREAFVAKTCNFAGNEVMVMIDPEPGLDEGGKLHIQSLDAEKITEHELMQRNREIFKSIEENGIKVTDIQVMPEPEMVGDSSRPTQIQRNSSTLPLEPRGMKHERD